VRVPDYCELWWRLVHGGKNGMANGKCQMFLEASRGVRENPRSEDPSDKIRTDD